MLLFGFFCLFVEAFLYRLRKVIVLQLYWVVDKVMYVGFLTCPGWQVSFLGCGDTSIRNF